MVLMPKWRAEKPGLFRGATADLVSDWDLPWAPGPLQDEALRIPSAQLRDELEPEGSTSQLKPVMAKHRSE